VAVSQTAVTVSQTNSAVSQTAVTVSNFTLSGGDSASNLYKEKP
jgi:hypothetical protein